MIVIIPLKLKKLEKNQQRIKKKKVMQVINQKKIIQKNLMMMKQNLIKIWKKK
jgi:hypothetical protein